MKNYKNREWLYQKYIIENLSLGEIAELCTQNRRKTGSVRYYLKKYNIERSREKTIEAMNASRIKTCQKKYGTNHHLSSINIREKATQTIIEKYGVEHQMQSKEIISKVEATNLKKYGVKCVLANEQIKEKAKQTNLNKFGFENPIYNKDCQEKRKATILKNFGDNAFSIISAKAARTKIERGLIYIINGMTTKELCENKNIGPTTLYSILANLEPDEWGSYFQHFQKNKTNIELFTSKQFNIEKYDKYYDMKRFPNLKYKPDFILKDALALNVDGLYWHSEVNKKKKYHFNMRKEYEKRNLRIIQIREDELYNKTNIVKSIINNAMGKTEIKIGARKTILKSVQPDEAKTFLNQNHMKGYIKSNHIGLYYNEQLIQILSYRKRKNIIKIDRMCSLVNHSVMGGAGKLLKHIERLFPDKKIHYWVDLRYGTGCFLEKLGYNLSHETLGWEWTDFKNTFNRLKCRANMGGRKLPQAQQAEEFGWFKIYDAGQRLWIKNS